MWPLYLSTPAAFWPTSEKCGTYGSALCVCVCTCMCDRLMEEFLNTIPSVGPEMVFFYCSYVAGSFSTDFSGMTQSNERLVKTAMWHFSFFHLSFNTACFYAFTFSHSVKQSSAFLYFSNNCCALLNVFLGPRVRTRANASPYVSFSLSSSPPSLAGRYGSTPTARCAWSAMASASEPTTTL